MPRGDLKEPAGKGHGTQRGLGTGGGGKSQARGSPDSKGKVIMSICRSCGYSEPHEGSPHAQKRCPNCGGLMMRN